MSIIKADKTNLNELLGLASLLFPEEESAELLDTYEEVIAKDNEIALLYRKDNSTIGYMHLSIRSDYVNGTNTSPVVYVEAIYVLPEYRKQEIGRELIEFAEEYARQKEIAQLASDCLIENTQSEAFHKSCGFAEEERVICFVKNVK